MRNDWNLGGIEIKGKNEKHTMEHLGDILVSNEEELAVFAALSAFSPVNDNP